MPSKATRNIRHKNHKPSKRTRRNRRHTRGIPVTRCIIRELKDGNVIIRHGDDEYETTYFHVCPSSIRSLKNIHERAVDDGSVHNKGQCPCMRFAKLEDRFLELEVRALCHHKEHGKCHIGKRSFNKMRLIHKDMLKEFGKELLKHHRTHLTTAMRCGGDSFTSSLSSKALKCPLTMMTGGAGPDDANSIQALQAKFREEVAAYKGKVSGDVSAKPYSPENQKVISEAYGDVLSAASAYLAAIKDHTAMTAEQRSYRYMCLKTELESFNQSTKLSFSRLRPQNKSPLSNGITAINDEIKRVLGADRVVANACSLIKEASESSQPVAVQPQPSSSPQPVSSPQPSSSSEPEYSSWSNPVMTQVAQDATKQEMGDMIKFDDEPKSTDPQQSEDMIKFDDEPKQDSPTEQAQPSLSSEDVKSFESSDLGADIPQPQPEAQPETQPETAMSEEKTDDAKCKVANIETGTLPCPGPGEDDSHKAIQQELSPEENVGCETKAAELLKDFNKRCPVPTQEEESTSQDDDITPKYDNSQEVPHSIPQSVTTSTTTTPHEGYNEIHIVVRVPQDYPQSTTGTTGTTFETAMANLTSSGQAQSGGSRRTKHSLYKRVGVTPKRHRAYNSSILRRKTIPKHRR